MLTPTLAPLRYQTRLPFPARGHVQRETLSS